MKSAVVLGSPRITGNNTEQHDAYTAPAAGSYRYPVPFPTMGHIPPSQLPSLRQHICALQHL